MKNIFISSTFRDMQAERDLVQEKVLPALRAEAKKYGDNVGVIDLRWGVDTSTLETDEGSAKVLKVCLDEIDRSHPYMLIFLGERYGWIPNGSLIERAVCERRDKYETDDYEKSVTALEIEYGALSEQYGDLSRCIVCFREPVSAEMDAENEAIYAEQNEKGRQKLEELKARIRKELGNKNRLISYTCKWDESAQVLKEFTSNGQPLEDVLVKRYIAMFQKDWEAYKNLSWQEKEQLVFRALMESKLRTFVGREQLLDEYYEKITNATQPIILQGEVGSGKTAIMSKLIDRMQKEGKKVFPFFCGMGNMSTKAKLLIEQMLYFVKKELGVEHDVSEDLTYDEILVLLRAYCITLKEEVYFFIDALDQLYMDEHVEKLDFIFNSKKVQMIASCTDNFDVNSAANLRCQKIEIPKLKTEEVKNVAKSILNADSRDYYTELETELLKKICIESPLYISLLIQRLNMMDQEELAQIDTAEEISAYGANLIAEMPDDVAEAAVEIFKNAAEKISGEAGGRLLEVVHFLAVSRTGLNIADLRNLFGARKERLPELDISHLMKYLDAFFYIGEDDRINFTHKVIRQGILDSIVNKTDYQKELRDYIKSIDISEDFYQREAMYYARVTNDVTFAATLMKQALEDDGDTLIKAIIDEAVNDEGLFYTHLLELDLEVASIVKQLLQQKVINHFDPSKRDQITRRNLSQALLKLLKERYQEQPDLLKLRELAISYEDVGRAFGENGQNKEALIYFQKSLKCFEEIHEKEQGQSSLYNLCVAYGYVGDALIDIGQPMEALVYLEKYLANCEKIYAQKQDDSSLQSLLTSYNSFAHAQMRLGQHAEALRYYEQALKHAEQLHEKWGSKFSLREVTICYGNVGEALEELGQKVAALDYYKKSIKHMEQLHSLKSSLSSAHDLFVSYAKASNILRSIGQMTEALEYCIKSLRYAEELHAQKDSLSSLLDLSRSNKNMGDILKEMGHPTEALTFYKEGLTYVEELHAKQESLFSLKDLSVYLSDMGQVLKDMGHLSEALSYYKESLKHAEQLHEKQGSRSSLRWLSNCNNYMGRILRVMGYATEALEYLEKCKKCEEELHAQELSSASLRSLSIIYDCVGDVLSDIGRGEEALTYYENSLKYAKELYEEQKTQANLREVSICYNKIGDALFNRNRREDSLFYYEKSLEKMEQLHAEQLTQSSLRELSICYHKLGNVLRFINRAKEALTYYEKGLRCFIETYESEKSLSALRELAIGYQNVGHALRTLDRVEDALEYYMNALKCYEDIHKEQSGFSSLKDLIVVTNDVAEALISIDFVKESIRYWEKLEGYVVELYELQPNPSYLEELINLCAKISSIHKYLGNKNEAYIYELKAYSYASKLYNKP